MNALWVAPVMPDHDSAPGHVLLASGTVQVGRAASRPPSPCPRTRSGKVMRRLLRTREPGLPEGDVSTLETPEAPKPPGSAEVTGMSGKES